MDTYIKKINRQLVAYYGTAEDFHPRFRLIWVNDHLEKRKVISSLNEDGSENYSIKEMPKYSYIRDRWMLEVHTPHQVEMTDVVTFDHYEPLWLFTQNKGDYYKPKIENCQMVISSFIEQVVNPIKKSDEVLKKEFEEKKLADEEKFLDVLQQEDTFLQQQLKHGEAVSFANLKEFKKES